ncbi:MAG: IS21-like element helper ATPase IstB [Acholeplasmatales bacterium]|nr:IS21-like element helper ATPase IstB [Acholeplasmatales bacterium]
MNQENYKKLKELNLSNMAAYYQDYNDVKEFMSLDFDSRLSVLLDFEINARRNKKITALAKKANFKIKPDITTIDFSPERNLDKELFSKLTSCTWISQCKNLVIAGATGTGKTYIASALGYRACMLNYKVAYIRVPRLMLDINISKADNTYNILMNKYKRVDLLILDDFGLAKMTAAETRDFLELVEDRDNIKSCIIISQLPITNWYDVFFDPTLADAVMDRLRSNSYIIELKGPSKRGILKNDIE